MKIAVVGGTGLVGRAMAESWRGDEVVLAGSRNVDIREPRQVREFLARLRPDWVALAAAYTDVDGCERDPQLADAVNHRGAAQVAEACAEIGARLLFLSTDYVFDGAKQAPYEPEDAVRPLSVYARSKADGEEAVRRILPQDSCVARVSWMFGAEKRCFPNTLLEWAATRAEVAALADQRSCPSYNHDVVKALAALVHAEARGTVHAVNGAGCSWYEFAQELIAQAGMPVRVKPSYLEQLGRLAVRPAYSVLSDASLRRYGIRVRHWREAIPEYLARRAALLGAEQPAAGAVPR